MQQKAHSEQLKHTKKNKKIQEKDVIKVSCSRKQQPLNQLMLTNLTNLQWNHKTFFFPLKAGKNVGVFELANTNL